MGKETSTNTGSDNSPRCDLWTTSDLFIHRFFANLVSLFFRVRTHGTWNIRRGRAVVLVCNYGSLADGLLAALALRKSVRFMVEKYWYEKPSLRWIWKMLKAICLDDSSQEAEQKMIEQIERAVRGGQSVCVFAEGSLSRTGFLRPLKRWVERIEGDYDIMPLYIGGTWKSSFGYYYGRPSFKFPLRRRPVGICIGEPMKKPAKAEEIHNCISLLSGQYFEKKKNTRKTLAQMFADNAKKNWNKRCASDGGGKEITFGQALICARMLADVLLKSDCGDKAAVYLPSSIAAVIANLAVSMAGKTAVNLNYSATEAMRAAAMAQCAIKKTITSKTFLAKIGAKDNFEGAIYFEDIVNGFTAAKKLQYFLMARFLPARMLCPRGKIKPEHPAAVIYSSGSSGKPKGVVLSEHNIISNVESLLTAYRFDGRDSLCGVLPLFHAFGYTCTFWLPMLEGVPVSYCPNPLDSDTIAKAASRHKPTFLFATPTFLSTYVKRVSVEDFSSLRIVVAGAEKLKASIADAFEKKFGVRPLEGYGATELSPVAALNVPDANIDGVLERGAKAGTIGRAVPGVSVKVLDAETSRPVGAGGNGVLYCKGPNVMQGYFQQSEKTAEAMSEGWYNTGDVAHIDGEGFIVMLDRLSRFSKIGGEMVPYIAIEEVYMSAHDFDEQVLAITSVPHERKSEELVVLYTAAAQEHIQQIHDFVAKSSLSNLWKPKRTNYYMIEQIPRLGSGKLDIMRLKKLALDAKLENDN